MQRYIRAYFETVPMLAAMVAGSSSRRASHSRTSVDIIVATNNFKGVRGHPILLAIFDECAFYSTDEASAKPDTELYAAVEPGLSSLEPAGSRIIGMSTPYKKSGLLYQKYVDHFRCAPDLRFLHLRYPAIQSLVGSAASVHAHWTWCIIRAGWRG